MSPPPRRGSGKGINDSPEPERDGATQVPSAPPGVPVLAERKAMRYELSLLADAGPTLPAKGTSCFPQPAQAGLRWVNRRLRRRQARNLDGRLTALVPAQPQR